jgi:cysteine desulfurase
VGATEHAAVRDNASLVAARGGRLVVIPVDAEGVISLEFVADHLAAEAAATALISVMAANNETGAIQPVEAVA